MSGDTQVNHIQECLQCTGTRTPVRYMVMRVMLHLTDP
jgi:hypothetical protein